MARKTRMPFLAKLAAPEFRKDHSIELKRRWESCRKKKASERGSTGYGRDRTLPKTPPKIANGRKVAAFGQVIERMFDVSTTLPKIAKSENLAVFGAEDGNLRGQTC